MANSVQKAPGSGDPAKPSGLAEFFGAIRFFGAKRQSPLSMEPGQRFRQRDASIWEIVRIVNFQVHPLPHVELVKIQPTTSESVVVRKIISVDALSDSNLFVPVAPGE